MDTAHHEPNYMNIFWALTILTIVEVLVPVIGVFSRPVNGTILGPAGGRQGPAGCPVLHAPQV